MPGKRFAFPRRTPRGGSELEAADDPRGRRCPGGPQARSAPSSAHAPERAAHVTAAQPLTGRGVPVRAISGLDYRYERPEVTHPSVARAGAAAHGAAPHQQPGARRSVDSSPPRLAQPRIRRSGAGRGARRELGAPSHNGNRKRRSQGRRPDSRSRPAPQGVADDRTGERGQCGEIGGCHRRREVPRARTACAAKRTYLPAPRAIRDERGSRRHPCGAPFATSPNVAITGRHSVDGGVTSLVYVPPPTRTSAAAMDFLTSIVE